MTTAVSLAQQVAPGVSLGFKNRLINGGMGIWQRATTWTGTASLGASGYTTADRWTFYAASSMTASQSTSVPSGFQYSLKVQRPNAAVTTNPMFAVQVVESVNMIDLAGQSVTLSFWAKAGANFSASGAILGAGVNTGTTADQGSATGLGGWAGSAQPLALSQAITTTWTKYSVTGTIAANALELDVVFSYTPTGTAGADDAFYITGVQLEVGTAATNFEFRDYGRELLMCQRYYQFGTNRMVKQNCDTLRNSYDPTNFPMTMRTAPTLTNSNTSSTNVGNANVAIPSANGFSFLWNSTSTVDFQNTFNWTASAEL